MHMSGGRAVVDALDAWGVNVVFGIPGIHTLALYDALYEHPRIRHVTTRHEQGAGFMADGYARASGKVGVVLTTTGPAAVNALTPIGEAYAESSPVLMIASGPTEASLGMDSGVLHEMRDQFGTLLSVTGQGRRVSCVEEIPEALHEAFCAMTHRRPRPFVLEIPLDVLSAEADVAPVEPVCDPPAMPDLQALDAAADVIRSARRPLIVAGGGSLDASAEVLALAERLHAPVFVTSNGLGSAPADHALCLGDAVSGWEIVRQADVVLAVGTRLGERIAQGWKGKPAQLIHLDIDDSVIDRRFPAAVALVGDARAGLQGLLARIEKTASEWKPDAIRSALKPTQDDGVFPDLIGTLRDVLDRDAVVVNDMTMMCYQARRLFPVYAPRTFLAPTTYGTLGFSMPAAVGAKIALPERQVVALCGDGGFLFTSQELATACQQGVSLPIVLCNDHRYTAIARAQDRTCEGRHIGVHLTNPDFVDFAHSFGAAAERVVSCAGLGTALKQALGADRPTLIEVDLQAFD